MSANYISLGSSCATAAGLDYAGVRKCSYPFDWLVSSTSSLYQCLEDDFKNFFINNHIREDGAALRDQYGFDHPHTLATTAEKVRGDWRDIVPKQMEIYQRRIQRFRDVMNKGEKIYLFRHSDMNEEEAQKIYDLIGNRYPRANFTLVVIKVTNENKPVVRDSNRRIIYHPFLLNDVYNDPVQWRQIIQSL